MPRRHTLSVLTERVERTQGDPRGWVPYNPPAASRTLHSRQPQHPNLLAHWHKGIPLVNPRSYSLTVY